MILELLILLLLLWIYSGGFGNNYNTKIEDDEVKINQVKSRLDDILSVFEEQPEYTIIITTDRTYVVNKETIHLVLRNPKTGQYFDDQTLLSVAIHELAHVICPDKDHTRLFDSIEYQLETVAIEKGYLDTNFRPDVMYPCHDER